MRRPTLTRARIKKRVGTLDVVFAKQGDIVRGRRNDDGSFRTRFGRVVYNIAPGYWEPY